jgi:hypothetical protein
MSKNLITEITLRDMINVSYERMSPEQKHCWDAIKVIPEKWTQDPFGNLTDGFWIVALIGNSVLWFNEIEEGFNRSAFHEYGVIDDYWCNQDELEICVQKVVNQIRDGYDSAEYCGAPQPVA